MKFTNLASIVLILLFSMTIKAQESTMSPQPTSMKEAQALAKSQNKTLVVEFYTDWCKYCKNFKAKTLSDKDVMESLSKNHVFIALNAEKQELDFVKQNKVKSYPAFFVYSPDGKLITKEKGFLKKDEFLKLINP